MSFEATAICAQLNTSEMTCAWPRDATLPANGAGLAFVLKWNVKGRRIYCTDIHHVSLKCSTTEYLSAHASISNSISFMYIIYCMVYTIYCLPAKYTILIFIICYQQEEDRPLVWGYASDS
jgi:hypothetical protein